MSFVKYTSAVVAVACTTYLGILVGRQHRRPSIHHHGGHDAPHHGPPRPPRPSKRAVGDDDLDAAAAERHHIHAEPHSPELIQWGDWSAGGRFTKPPVKPYDSSYPQLTNLWEIVQRWNPDNVTMPVPFQGDAGRPQLLGPARTLVSGGLPERGGPLQDLRRAGC